MPSHGLFLQLTRAERVLQGFYRLASLLNCSDYAENYDFSECSGCNYCKERDLASYKAAN